MNELNTLRHWYGRLMQATPNGNTIEELDSVEMVICDMAARIQQLTLPAISAAVNRYFETKAIATDEKAIFEKAIPAIVWAIIETLDV